MTRFKGFWTGWSNFVVVESLLVFIRNPESELFKSLEIDDTIKQEIFLECKRKLSPSPIKIRAEFDLTCYSYNGIEAIRKAI